MTKYSVNPYYHTAPSSPPVIFRGHNISSTSIKLTWSDVPKALIYGILGFYVTCERVGNMSEERHVQYLAPTKHEWAFKGLQKYSSYSCRLRAYNNFGNGNWSRGLIISTDKEGMFIEGYIRF